MGLHETATIDVEQCNVLMMLPTLHCPQGGLIIYVGEGLIEKDPPYWKSHEATVFEEYTAPPCKGGFEKYDWERVTNTMSPYQNGAYQSGMTWDGYAKWCLSAI